MKRKIKVGDCVTVTQEFITTYGSHLHVPTPDSVGYVVKIVTRCEEGYLVQFLDGSRNDRPVDDEQICEGWWVDDDELIPQETPDEV